MKTITIDDYTLKVQPSSFEHAMALTRAIADVLAERGIDIGFSSAKIDREDLFQSDISEETLSSWITTALATLTNPTILSCLFTCAQAAVIEKGEKSWKVDRDFFEYPEENREYFYPIMIQVAMVNVSPFFKKINLWFMGMQEIISSIPKST